MAAADEGRIGGLQNARRLHRMGSEVGCGSRWHDRRCEAGQADATGDDNATNRRGIRADVMTRIAEVPKSPARVSNRILKISGSST
jgi:hypothetical protein